VLGLLVLAPWVGEYLLGNVSVRELAALPVLAPMYGGGALLVREIARRSGRGWPSIVLLGLAYGIVEAGLVDQSLFNSSFESLHYQEATAIPGLGFTAANAVAFVIGHAVWSIGAPIAVVELWTPARARAPWLGRVGFAVTVLCYLGGCALVFVDMYRSEEFLATPAQLAGAAVAALAFGVIALVVLPRSRPHRMDVRVPRPWLLGVGTLVVAGVFFSRPETWFGVGLGLALAAAAWWVVGRWSRHQAWGRWHVYGLVTGAMLTYAWGGFVLTDLLDPDDQVRRIGNGVFACCAVLLLIATAWRIRSGTHDPDERVPKFGGDSASTPLTSELTTKD